MLWPQIDILYAFTDTYVIYIYIYMPMCVSYVRRYSCTVSIKENDDDDEFFTILPTHARFKECSSYNLITESLPALFLAKIYCTKITK